METKSPYSSNQRGKSERRNDPTRTIQAVDRFRKGTKESTNHQQSKPEFDSPLRVNPKTVLHLQTLSLPLFNFGLFLAVDARSSKKDEEILIV